METTIIVSCVDSTLLTLYFVRTHDVCIINLVLIACAIHELHATTAWLSGINQMLENFVYICTHKHKHGITSSFSYWSKHDMIRFLLDVMYVM